MPFETAAADDENEDEEGVASFLSSGDLPHSAQCSWKGPLHMPPLPSVIAGDSRCHRSVVVVGCAQVLRCFNQLDTPVRLDYHSSVRRRTAAEEGDSAIGRVVSF